MENTSKFCTIITDNIIHLCNTYNSYYIFPYNININDYILCIFLVLILSGLIDKIVKCFYNNDRYPYKWNKEDLHKTMNNMKCFIGCLIMFISLIFINSNKLLLFSLFITGLILF